MLSSVCLPDIVVLEQLTALRQEYYYWQRAYAYNRRGGGGQSGTDLKGHSGWKGLNGSSESWLQDCITTNIQLSTTKRNNIKQVWSFIRNLDKLGFVIKGYLVLGELSWSQPYKWYPRSLYIIMWWILYLDWIGKCKKVNEKSLIDVMQ